MSLLQFIASDEPLKNVENPYIKWISINQAIKNKKKYCSEITWRYTDKRAKQLLEYIHDHLKDSNEVELWRIWMDANSTPTIYKVMEEELRLKHIKKIFKQDGFNIPECVIITKGK